MLGSVERVLEALGADVLSFNELARKSGLWKTALYHALLILVLDRKVLIDRSVPGKAAHYGEGSTPFAWSTARPRFKRHKGGL